MCAKERWLVESHLSVGFLAANLVTVVNNLALLLQFFDILQQAKFADGAHGRSGYFQGYPFAGLRHKEFLRLKVGVKAAFRFAVGVRNVVSCNWLFARQITNFRHCFEVLNCLFILVTPRGLEPLTF